MKPPDRTPAELVPGVRALPEARDSFAPTDGEATEMNELLQESGGGWVGWWVVLACLPTLRGDSVPLLTYFPEPISSGCIGTGPLSLKTWSPGDKVLT